MATPDKPQVCHPSGFNSSLRLEENKVSANNGRDLSSLSRKTNEDGKEDASLQWYYFVQYNASGLISISIYISAHIIKYMWFIYTFSNEDQNNSKAGSQNDKRKENKKSSKADRCTTKCEDDLIDDQGNYRSSFLTRHRDILLPLSWIYFVSSICYEID